MPAPMSSSDERTPLLASTSRDTLDSPESPPSAHQDADIIARVSVVLGALKAGKLPSTDQINTWLEAALSSDILLAPGRTGPPLLQGRLSEPTYELLLHLRAGLEAIQKVLKSKNGKNESQELIWTSERLAMTSQQPQLGPSAQDLSQALLSLQTLLWLVLRNFFQESRALVEDLVWTLRTVAADTAEDVSHRADRAARTLRPGDVSEEGVQKAQGQGQEVLGSLAARQAHAGQEGRARVLFRLNKAMESIRTDPESTQAANTLLSLARKYLHPDASSSFKPSPQLHNALKEFRQAFLRFLAPWTDVDLQSEHVQKQLQIVLEGPRANQEIRSLLESSISFGQSVLADPSYAQSTEAQESMDVLSEQLERVKSQHSDWWSALTDLLRIVEAAMSQALHDPDLQAVTGSLAALTSSTMDLSRLGAKTLLGETRGLVSDLFNVLLPRLLGTITRCPFPRVEYKSPFMDAVCDDFVLQELYPLPTYLRFDTNSSAAFQSSTDLSSQNAFDAAADLEAQPSQEFSSHSRLFLRGIHFSARDISFYIRRKAFYWLPCFRQETGFVDFTLAGGAEADIDFADATEEGRFVDVKSVTVRLPGLDLRVRQSFHPLLMWITRPLVRSALKVALRYVLSTQLKEALESGDERLFGLWKKARGYEKRGFSKGQAWITAIMEKDQATEAVEQQQQEQEQAEEEEEQQQRQEEQPDIPGPHLTSKGIVKPLDASEESALAVGAGAQLLPTSEAGPEHFGPSGSHGPGSSGRIAAELDAGTKTAADELKGVQAQGRKAVENVGKMVRDVPRVPERVHQAEQREESRSGGWQSPVFNL